MKKLLLVILIFLALNVKAQLVENWRSSLGLDSTSNGVVQGVKTDSLFNKYIFFAGANQQNGIVMKVDKSGKLLWQQCTQLGQISSSSSSMAFDKDWNLIICGSDQSGAAFIKYSPSGEELCFKEINSLGVNNNLTLTSVLIDKTGNLYYYGDYGTSNNDYLLYMLKVTSLGNLAWFDTINVAPVGSQESIVSATFDENNDIVFSGIAAPSFCYGKISPSGVVKYLYNPSSFPIYSSAQIGNIYSIQKTIYYTGINNSYKYFIAKADSSGNIIYNKSVVSTKYSNTNLGTKPNLEKQGSNLVYTGVGSNSSGLQLVYIARVDTAANLLADVAYTTATGSRTLNSTKCVNNQIVVTGYLSNNYNMYVATFDTMCNLLWEKTRANPTGSGSIQCYGVNVTNSNTAQIQLTANIGVPVNGNVAAIYEISAAGNIIDSNYYKLRALGINLGTTAENFFVDSAGNSYILNDLAIGRVDNQGKQLWLKSGFGVHLKDIIKSGNYLYVTGMGTGNDSTYLAKVDLNGNLIWKKIYPYGQGNTMVADNQNNIYIGALSSNTTKFTLLKCSMSNGSLIWASNVAQQDVQFYYQKNAKILFNGTNAIYLGYSCFYNYSYDAYGFAKINTNGTVIWRKLVNNIPSSETSSFVDFIIRDPKTLMVYYAFSSNNATKIDFYDTLGNLKVTKSLISNNPTKSFFTDKHKNIYERNVHGYGAQQGVAIYKYDSIGNFRAVKFFPLLAVNFSGGSWGDAYDFQIDSLNNIYVYQGYNSANLAGTNTLLYRLDTSLNVIDSIVVASGVGTGFTSMAINPTGSLYLYGCVTMGQTSALFEVKYCVTPILSVIGSHNYNICVGDTVHINTVGSSVYSWLPAANISNASLANPNLFPTTSTVYTVTTNYAGCLNATSSNTSTISVAVLTPTLSIHTIPSTSNICLGDSMTLSCSGATTYTWSNGVNNGISFVPNITATYTVTAIGSGGCKNIDSIKVTVNSLPHVVAQTTSIVTCAGSTITLTGAGANNYIWNNGAVNAIAFSPAITNTYVVIGTDLNNCKNKDSITVAVNPLPNITAYATLSSICAGATDTLKASGANTYTWSTTQTTATIVPPTMLLTTDYTVSGTDINNCTNTNTLSVVVNPLPTVSINSPVSACLPLCTTFTATSSNDVITYNWDFGNGQSSVNASPIQCFTVAGTSVVTLTVTDVNACISTATSSVTVAADSVPSVNLQLVQDTAPHIWDLYVNYSTSVTNATWYWGDGTDTTTLYPTHMYTASGKYNICVTVFNACGDSTNYCQNDSIYRYYNNTLSSMVAVNVINGTAPSGITTFNAQHSAILFYPNPTQNNFTIETNSSEKQTIQIYDVNGKLVLTQTIRGKTNIDVSNLAAGVYNLSLQNSTGVINKCLVIAR